MGRLHNELDPAGVSRIAADYLCSKRRRIELMAASAYTLFKALRPRPASAAINPAPPMTKVMALTTSVETVLNTVRLMSFTNGGIMSGIKSFAFATAATLISLAVAGPAQCQAIPTSVGARATAGTYNFNVGDGSVFVDGMITTDSNGHATAISGLVNGTDAITGLSTYAAADNDLYATGAWVTFQGVSFSTTSLGDFNFYNSGLGYYGLLSSITAINGYPDGVIFTAHVAPVPEPGTWAMMLFGFAAAGLAVRRQRRTIKYISQAA
jgi:PEP-CTERM motif-containing protein